jgi:hypothetical protein
MPPFIIGEDFGYDYLANEDRCIPSEQRIRSPMILILNYRTGYPKGRQNSLLKLCPKRGFGLRFPVTRS